MRRRPFAPYVASSRSRSGSCPEQKIVSARSNDSATSTGAWSSASSRKRGSMPTANGCARRSRAQKPWIVETQAPSSRRARSGRPRARSAARIRARSSPAALRVYVMTSTDSTSRPCSHTAPTNRSTSTVVLPVPAPAETKTSPFARTAACCSGFIVSRPLDTAHRPEVAPARALAALRVVPDVPRADAPREAGGTLPRRVHHRPELVVRQVVVLLVARQVVGRVLTQEPARDARAAQRAVDAAERLDADEVAQNEQVERDLELQLLVDLLGGVRAPRLVVLHDPARAVGIDVDPVDLAAELDPVGELEPTLQLGRRAIGAEAHLEPARNERERRVRLVADEGLEVAPERSLQLGRLELGELEPHAAA